MRMKIVDGLVWLVITDKAKEVHASGLFELYALYDDGTEALILTDESLQEAQERGLEIGIEVGHL